MNILPDKLVQTVIQAGLASIATTPAILADLLDGYDATTRTYVQTYFTQHPNLKVRLGWPQPTISFPIINVILGAENEQAQNDLLGDHVDDQYMDEGGGGDDPPVTQVERLGYASQVQLQVAIITGNEDLTPFLYHVVKRILLAAKITMETSGLMNVTLSGGDFRFEEGFFPEFAYTRMLSVTGLTYFTMQSDTVETVIKSIQVALTSVMRVGTDHVP